MTPAERALCDRLIYDIACLEHAVSSLTDEEIAASIPGAEVDMRGILAHVLSNHEALNAALSGEPQTERPICPPRIDTATGVDIEDLFEGIADERDATIDMLADRPDDEDRPLDETIERRSRHYFDHGLQIVAAFPVLHTDPLLLAWTLRAHLEGDQRALQDGIRTSAAELLEAAQESPEEA